MKKEYSVLEQYFEPDGVYTYRESRHVPTRSEARQLLNDATQEIVFDIAGRAIKTDGGRTIYLNDEGEEIAVDFDGDHDAIVRLWEGYEDRETDRDYSTIANLDILCWSESV